MHYGWASIGIPTLINGNYSFRITSEEGSWLASMISIGDFLGDILGYSLISTFGKKNIILWSCIPLVISWILTAAGPSAPYLFAGKLMAGLVDGILFTTVPTFMAEIADPKIRGFLGLSYAVTLVIGMLIMNILMYLLPMEIAGYIAIAFNIPLFVTFPFLPDSAYFYLLKNDTDAAKASLQKYSGRGEVDEDLARISEAIQEEMKDKRSVFNVMLESTFLKAIFISVAINILNQFTGSGAILMYSATVFEDSKSFLDPQISNIILYFVYFIFITISTFLIDNYGRRLLLVVSCTGAIVCLVGNATFLTLKQYSLISAEQDYLQLVVLLLYISFYAIGLSSIPVLVSSELFSPRLKGLGLCLTNIAYSITSTITIKFFTFTSENVGMFLPFYVFGFWTLITLLFTIFILPETKGKSLEDIQKILKVFVGNHRNKKSYCI